ncbi:serine/threonine-protein phosphatase [Schaalia sp. 19OD2882]|nr:serine/threonine-protein phosphatase [Schaalia sp. 19OD2882]
MAQTRWGAASDIGPVRALNEDSWIAAPPFFAVADGMGGHAGGDRASRTSLQTMRDMLCESTLGGRLPGLPDVDAAVTESAVAVAALASHTDPALAPGTTLTGVLCVWGQDGPDWLVFNIGDSRTYLVGHGVARLLTKDHSAAQEARDYAAATGVPVVLPPSNVVTRALGASMPGLPKADYTVTPMYEGDHVVICSDGVHGVLSDEEIAQVVTSGPDPQTTATALVDLALTRGTRDNATALVVRADSVVRSDLGQHAHVATRPVMSVVPVPKDTARRPRTEGGQ